VIIWLWGINGLLQGAGGPSLSKLVIDFFPPKKRSSAWTSLLNVIIFHSMFLFD
jgi:sugar phosphate permease